ncbi:MAG: cell division protein FtsA [Candidatus Sumerlaeia bacterium]|nr:cell division protein FtsA [Candidatus Sumerlaeia bacterium]
MSLESTAKKLRSVMALDTRSEAGFDGSVDSLGLGSSNSPVPAPNNQAIFRTGFKPPTRTRTFAGLDIGTTKICAIIAEIDPSGRTNIKGIASTPSQGLRRGVVVDLDETVVSIRTAIRKAEEIAKVNVKDVLVGIAGGHIQCIPNQATVDVANPERGITNADISRAIDKATVNKVPMEREVIHTLPQRFTIDDGVVAHPEGFSSQKLTAEVLTVTAAVTSAQNIVRAVRQAHYRTSGIYLEPLASSLAVLTPEEKELGVLVIDIGGGTTDIALWSEGSVRYTGVVPFGGDAITEDIRKCLKISCYDAENLKKRHGSCLPEDISADEKIEVPLALTGEMQQIERKLLCEVIESRLGEMLLMVREECERCPHYAQTFGGVVLTGGGSLQHGADKLAEKIFKLPTKIGKPSGLSGLSSIASSPIYATGVGLIFYGLQHEQCSHYSEGNMFKRMMQFFKRAIDWHY